MSIKSIQSTQVVPTILRSPERSYAKVDTGARLSPEPSALVGPGSSPSGDTAQASVAQLQAVVNRIDYIEEQLNKILVDFPPFWPPGTFQRADLIKGIRSIQDEVEKSSMANVRKQDNASLKLEENATDQEISAALDHLFNLRDELGKSITNTAEALEPGTMFSIRV